MYTFLMRYNDTSWEKLTDIKGAPAMGGAPNMKETTTMSDWMQTFIAGIQTSDAKEFPCNYDKAEYKKLKALEGKTEKYSLWLGGQKEGSKVTPTGTYGKFTFEGQLAVWLEESEVDGVHNMRMSIAPSTPIEMEDDE